MRWRIVILLLVLPFQFVSAEPDEISATDVMFGGIWLKAIQNSSPSLSDLPENKFVKHHELAPKYDAKKIEGEFFQFVTGENHLVMMGVHHNKLKLFIGAPGKLQRAELRSFAEPDKIKDVRFAMVAKAVKDALAHFAKGQGILATQFQELQLHTLGAYSIVSMRLNPELEAVQLFQLMNAITKETQSCNAEVSDWQSR